MTPVQSAATIDTTAIQHCLFCAEAMTFVKTVETPVQPKIKLTPDPGSVFHICLTPAAKTNAESCWNRLRVRGHLC